MEILNTSYVQFQKPARQPSGRVGHIEDYNSSEFTINKQNASWLFLGAPYRYVQLDHEYVDADAA